MISKQQKNELTVEERLERDELAAKLTKEFTKLTITDDFMFGKVMTKKSICVKVLNILTGREIEDVHCVIDQRAMRVTSDSKGTRYDIYVETEKETFDAEMQNKGNESLIKELPKRSRFYQGMIDLNVLKKGDNYEELKDSYVIFICTFDPFGEGLCCYNYENTCKDGERRLLGDGRNILFFNTKGTVNNVSKEVKAMLDYMETGKVNDEMTKTLDYEVEQLHFDGPALADYLIRQMQQRTRDKIAEERGMKRGIEQGMKQGIERGMKQGIEQGMKQGIERGMKQGIEQGKISMLKQFLDGNLISIEDAAGRMDVTVEELEQLLKNN